VVNSFAISILKKLFSLRSRVDPLLSLSYFYFHQLAKMVRAVAFVVVALVVAASGQRLANLPEYLQGLSLDDATTFENCNPSIAKTQPGHIDVMWLTSDEHDVAPDNEYFQNVCEESEQIHVGLKGFLDFGRGGDTKLVGGELVATVRHKDSGKLVAKQTFDACLLGACCEDPTSAPRGLDEKVCKMNYSPMRTTLAVDLPNVYQAEEELEFRLVAMGFVMQAAKGKRAKELFCVKKNIVVEKTCEKRGGEWVSHDEVPHPQSQDPSVHVESAAARRKATIGFDAAEYLAGTSAGRNLNLQGIPEKEPN